VKRPILDLGWITVERLARHLGALRDGGCRFVGLSRYLEDPPAATSEAGEVVVGFGDEGFEFLESAWPLLKQWDVPVVLFVRTAQVGRIRRPLLPGSSATPCLGWSELRQLVREGVSVQSAGHHGLDASRVPAEMVFGDLIRSRRELENRLGQPPVALQYPYDQADATARELAAQAGFQLGFAAGIEPPFAGALNLGRVPVGTFTQRGRLVRRLRRVARAMQA
jgi:peptidoglycan/xylan/chitin deacetylase (PgdA/CDA1 family)